MLLLCPICRHPMHCSGECKCIVADWEVIRFKCGCDKCWCEDCKVKMVVT